MIILPVLPLFLRIFGYKGVWVNILAWAGYTGLGFMSLLFVFVLLRDLGWISYNIGHKIWFIFNSPKNEMSIIPERREFLIQSINLAVLSLSGAATAYGFYQARRKPNVIKQEIYLKNLPLNFDNFKIVQFSDLHIGPTIKRDFVETVVKQIEELNADMIVFTGDLVDGSVNDIFDDVRPVEKLSAPHGKFFVTGNHEYYSNAPTWLKKVKDMGFDILNNEHRVIEKSGDQFTLAGITDFSAGKMLKEHKSDPEKALNGSPQGNVKILLAHQPKSIYLVEKSGANLQISGHTHGGQFFPGNFLARIDQPFISGLSKYKDMQIYVNRGTGYWGPPLRFGTKSE